MNCTPAITSGGGSESFSSRRFFAADYMSLKTIAMQLGRESFLLVLRYRNGVMANVFLMD